MATYVVFPGDTYDRISRNVYGEESNANLIRRSNPGIVEPLSSGTIVNIPVDPSNPTNQPQRLTSNNPAQITISVKSIVGGVESSKQFTFWQSVTIKRSLDSLSTLALTAPFDPDDEDIREFFRPFTFREITVSVGGNEVFIGTIVNITPQLTETRSIVNITAYSLPGIMADCTQPVSDYPLSWEQYTLKEIADDVAATFGIRTQFNDSVGDVFQSVSSKPESSALSFLQDLAKQRNLVIGDTRDGFLLFQKSTKVGFPVARLFEGLSPLISITPRFNAQQAFTSVTGINPTTAGVPGEPFTAQTGIPGGRYHTYTVRDTLNTSLEDAVNAKVGRMYGNMASYNVKVPTWFTPGGQLWSPNSTIKITAPKAMVYNEYEFIIRSVELQRTAQTEVTSLELVLPGAFSGEIPVSLPWE